MIVDLIDSIRSSSFLVLLGNLSEINHLPDRLSTGNWIFAYPNMLILLGVSRRISENSVDLVRYSLKSTFTKVFKIFRRTRESL